MKRPLRVRIPRTVVSLLNCLPRWPPVHWAPPPSLPRLLHSTSRCILLTADVGHSACLSVSLSLAADVDHSARLSDCSFISCCCCCLVLSCLVLSVCLSVIGLELLFGHQLFPTRLFQIFPLSMYAAAVVLCTVFV